MSFPETWSPGERAGMGLSPAGVTWSLWGLQDAHVEPSRG